MVQDKFIIRRVRVDRSLTPQQILDATGRKQCHYNNVHAILETMPRQGAEEVDVYFFLGRRCIPAIELANELDSRGLIADPYAQFAVNIDDPMFADEHPNTVQWQDKKGSIYCAAFSQWQGERRVFVFMYDGVWHDYCWFGGVRKV